MRKNKSKVCFVESGFEQKFGQHFPLHSAGLRLLSNDSIVFVLNEIKVSPSASA